MGDSHLTELKSLRLNTAQITADELHALFVQHRSKLEQVQLCNIKLLTGRWRNVFQELAGSLVVLNSVRLRGRLCSFGGKDYTFADSDIEDARLYGRLINGLSTASRPLSPSGIESLCHVQSQKAEVYFSG